MMNKAGSPKTALLLNAFWVHGQGMSGGDQMAIQIFSRIQKRFSSFLCLSNPDGVNAARDGLQGASFVSSPACFDRFPLIVSYILRTIYMIFRLSRQKVDIVYSSSDFFPDVIPACVYSILHPQSIWIQCVFHIYPHWRKRPGNKFVNLVASQLQNFSLMMAKRANGVVNINTEVRSFLIARGFDASKLTIITPGVDLAYIHGALASPDTPVYEAVFLGRLKPSKGIFDLPDIWKHVVHAHPAARLALVGGGSDAVRMELEEKCKEAGVEDNIRILGFLESKDIYALFKRAKVFVFPSHEEGFGIVLVEALACGLQVVAWDLPVFEELFGRSILTIPEGDCVAFASAIAACLDATTEQRDVAAANGRACADRYGWEAISDAMGEWLTSLTQRTR